VANGPAAWVPHALNPLLSAAATLGRIFAKKTRPLLGRGCQEQCALLAKNAPADIKKFASVMAISSFHSQSEMKKATRFAHLFVKRKLSHAQKNSPSARVQHFKGKSSNFSIKVEYRVSKSLLKAARAAVKIKPASQISHFYIRNQAQ
jgi:hypothetical protein